MAQGGVISLLLRFGRGLDDIMTETSIRQAGEEVDAAARRRRLHAVSGSSVDTGAESATERRGNAPAR